MPVELERLYDRHAQALFAFLLNFTRREDDTRDLLQDVFVKIARQPGLLRAARDNTPMTIARSAPPSPHVLLLLARQKLLLAKLVGPADDVTPTDRPKTFVPRPRSEMRLDIIVL